MQALQHSQVQTQEHMASMEEMRRWKNIKMRGLPETMEAVPYFFRRLLTYLFSVKQAKGMPLHGWYRIPKMASSTPETRRDVIVRFQQNLDRLLFMAVIRSKSPLRFEGAFIPTDP
ncbi:Hypothetical predicted protein [Pelobates cultripes]|uniref:Uncharacterized protein n=1 Tax=Pelobates cultripes TaxID=61616 RepID=A0AAD1RJ60_PELCU|nr:Hypothetical predicted protein [Pelobates cultripes]